MTPDIPLTKIVGKNTARVVRVLAIMALAAPGPQPASEQENQDS